MSIPGVINMHNVFHNPAQYNYASLFQNTLALAFSKAHNTCLFGLLVLCLPFFPRNDKEAAECYSATLWCWMWTYTHFKLATDLKLKTKRDQNCVVKLPVLTGRLCVSLAVCVLTRKTIYLFLFPVKFKTNVHTQFKLHK